MDFPAHPEISTPMEFFWVKLLAPTPVSSRGLRPPRSWFARQISRFPPTALGAIEGVAQPSECQSAEHQTEIAQGHVEVTGDSKKIEDNKQQPGGHDISENPRLKKDANAG